MKYQLRVSAFRVYLMLVLALALITLFGAHALDSKANAPANRLFDSYLAPTPTSVAPRPSSTVAPGTRPSPTPGVPGPPPRVLTTRKIYLPLALKKYPSQLVYGWKGVGDPGQLDAHPSDGFWEIYPDWWYNWGANGPFVGGQGIRSVAETLAGLEAGLQDPRYVPMIWCMADVNAGPTPAQVANLARQYPGRVWLVFNEPDNNIDQCGSRIDQDPRYHPFFQNQNWTGLGTYLAQQYILYRDAIKAADPYSRLFPLGLLHLPMPNLQGQSWDRAIPIWNAFAAELSRQGRYLDGVAIHAYPYNVSTFHQGCTDSHLDHQCVKESLLAAHGFFQSLSMTTGKPIWITEIGTLASDLFQSWTTTRDGFENPMLQWFNQHIKPGQDCQYLNAISWFSTHYYGNQYTDFTASDLLDYKQAQQGLKLRTPVC